MAYFRGTSAEQDSRFKDKTKKLMRTLKFPDNFTEKLDKSNVKLEALLPWITAKVTGLMGFEDEVLISLIQSMLEDTEDIDPRRLQIDLTPFLERKTSEFVRELWDMLLSAQNNPYGIPDSLMASKSAELAAHKKIAEEANRTRDRSERKSRWGDDSQPADPPAAPPRERSPERVRERERERERERGNGGGGGGMSSFRDRDNAGGGDRGRDRDRERDRGRDRSRDRPLPRRSRSPRRRRSREKRRSRSRSPRRRSPERRRRSRSRDRDRDRDRDVSGGKHKHKHRHRRRHKSKRKDRDHDETRESEKEKSEGDKSEGGGVESGEASGSPAKPAGSPLP